MRIVRKILLAAVLFLIVVYGCDEIYARVRSNPFADVHIDQLLAVHEKFNKIDYERIDSDNGTLRLCDLPAPRPQPLLVCHATYDAGSSISVDPVGSACRGAVPRGTPPQLPP